MRKLFGDLLVEKEIVKSEELVDSLVEQSSKLFSTVEIIHHSKLLSPENILKALSLQTHKGIGFRSACVELNFWSKDLDQKVEQKIREIRIPLGQILIKRGVVTTEQLIEALDEFLSGMDDDDVPSGDLNSIKWIPHFYPIESSLLSEYVTYFSKPKREELLHILSLLSEAKATLIESTFNQLFEEVHLRKGIARLIRAEILERLLTEAEHLIEMVKSSANIELKVVTDLLVRIIDLVWEIKDTLQISGSEKAYWDDVESHKKCINLLIDIEKLILRPF